MIRFAPKLAHRVLAAALGPNQLSWAGRSAAEPLTPAFVATGVDWTLGCALARHHCDLHRPRYVHAGMDGQEQTADCVCLVLAIVDLATRAAPAAVHAVTRGAVKATYR